MKKLIAALLVLTMVLALTGSAFAASIKVGDYVKFTKNSYAYTAPHSYKQTKDPQVIVNKGSIGEVVGCKNGYYYIRITPIYGGYAYALWFKKGDVKLSAPSKDTGDVKVWFSNGGNGFSWELTQWVDTVNTNKCHVKATAKVWMHKDASLRKSFGKALHKGDVVKYRHVQGMDSRGVIFYGIRYKGNNLFVSRRYSKLVK